MITDDNNESVEAEVLEILEAAGWADDSRPDHGRIEVIAYRACLEAAVMQSTRSAAGRACCSAPVHRPHPSFDLAAPSRGKESFCVCGSSIPSSSRFVDERPDPESRAGSSRA